MRHCLKLMLVSLVVGIFGSAPASAVITNGLVGYWSFDEDFTATISGPGFDPGDLDGFGMGVSIGPAISEPTIDTTAGNWVFGGGALRLEREMEHRVEIEPFDKNLLEAGSPYSYSAWYRLEHDIIGSDRHFVLESLGGFPVSYGLRLDDEVQKGQVFSQGTFAGNPSFFVDNEETQGAVTGQWHHIVVTFDPAAFDVGGTIFAEFTAYLDGQEAGSLVAQGNVIASPGLVIGGHRAGSGRNFQGWIDEVAVWNRVLSADEVAFLNANAIEPITAPLGDYNRNGLVDAADYTVWRDSLGETGLDLPADGSGNLMVDMEDYTIWKSNFGMGGGGGLLGGAAAVPEPSFLGLVVMAGLMLVARGRRRR